MPDQDCFSTALGPRCFKNKITTLKAFFMFHREASLISLEPDFDYLGFNYRGDCQKTTTSIIQNPIESICKALEV